MPRSLDAPAGVGRRPRCALDVADNGAVGGIAGILSDVAVGNEAHTVDLALGSQFIVFGTTLTADRTLSLPAAAAAKNYIIYVYRDNDAFSYAVIIDPDGSEVIQGPRGLQFTTVELWTPGEVVGLRSNGTKWIPVTPPQWVEIPESDRAAAVVLNGGQATSYTEVTGYSTLTPPGAIAVEAAALIRMVGNGALDQEYFYWATNGSASTDVDHIKLGWSSQNHTSGLFGGSYAICRLEVDGDRSGWYAILNASGFLFTYTPQAYMRV